MVSLSVLLLIFVVGYQISNATKPLSGTNFLISKISGSRGFGVVRTGYAEDETKIEVKVMTKNEDNSFILYEEFLTLRSLKESQNEPLYLPKPLGYRELIVPTEGENGGPETQRNYEAMAIELLGFNLKYLQRNLQKKAPFGTFTQTHLATKLFAAVQGIHAGGFVHRDLNPIIIALRPEDITEIAIIDFGFAVKADKVSTFFIGTSEFLSLNAHHNKIVDKLQDLESLFYNLIQFSMGSLPWSKYIHHANDAIPLFKRTLFRTLTENHELFPYTESEKSMLRKYGKRATKKIAALKAHLTQQQGLNAYAMVLVQIMIREKDNEKQNVTDQDYVDLLAGFTEQMGKFKEAEKKLDWADTITPEAKSSGIEFKEEPMFSMEEGESLLHNGKEYVEDEESDEDENDDEDETDDEDENGDEEKDADEKKDSDMEEDVDEEEATDESEDEEEEEEGAASGESNAEESLVVLVEEISVPKSSPQYLKESHIDTKDNQTFEKETKEHLIVDKGDSMELGDFKQVEEFKGSNPREFRSQGSLGGGEEKGDKRKAEGLPEGDGQRSDYKRQNSNSHTSS